MGDVIGDAPSQRDTHVRYLDDAEDSWPLATATEREVEHDFVAIADLGPEVAVPTALRRAGNDEVIRQNGLIAVGFHLPKNPMGDAIGYALRQWDTQVPYLDDGKLDIDNNRVER